MDNEKKKVLTIIVPCYNEQETARIFFNAIADISQKTALKELEVNTLFVNDGSSDGTLNVIKELASESKHVKYLSLSRNFGKESSIYAGLENANADYVAIMDVDLQDPPELLEEMYLSIKNEHFDCVATRRSTREGEPIIRSFFARQFYKIINLISQTEIVDGARDFRLMTRQMADSILMLRESNRFSKGIFSWVGFSVKWLTYENKERVAGQTKWSFWNLFGYSINGIIAFSEIPLAFVSILGIIISFVSFVLILIIVVRKLTWGDPVAGWASLAAMITFIGGLQMFCLGIIGQYLAKAYVESKKRPIYIIKESHLHAD